VHGILWVFEMMIQESLNNPQLACEKLTALMLVNSWLPIPECRKRIEIWSGQ
jgi:hypothetical protein